VGQPLSAERSTETKRVYWGFANNLGDPEEVHYRADTLSNIPALWIDVWIQCV